MKHLKSIGCGVAVVTIGLGCLLYWLFASVPRRQFDRLLAGDERVEITSVTITSNTQRSVIDDPESLRYLTDLFRAATHERSPSSISGTDFQLGLRMNTIGTYTASIHIPDDRNGFVLRYPIDTFDDPGYYWLPFTQPAPATLRNALNQMKR
jgi:hypothetical protein